MSSTVGIFAAKNQFSHLVALAEDGQETIITRHGRPVARIVPPAETPVRRLGAQRGQWQVPDGWDEFTEEDYQLWYEAPITADPIEGMS